MATTMAEAVFSPAAKRDLDGILDYIARDNPTAALRFVDSLRDKCRTLAQYPLLGAARENLAKGLRVFSVGNYGI